MIRSSPFRISFIATIIALTTILVFLVTDYNSKNINFKNSPSILKIEMPSSKCYDIEIIGTKYKFTPIEDNLNPDYKPVLRALLPKNLKLIETLIFCSISTYNEFINYRQNLDYLKNIENSSK